MSCIAGAVKGNLFSKRLNPAQNARAPAMLKMSFKISLGELIRNHTT